MMFNKAAVLLMVGLSSAFVVACDDGDDDEASDETGDGDGDGDPGDGDGDGDRDPDTGDGDSNGDFGGTDGELEGCALERTAEDCNNTRGCGAVYGQALIDDGAGGWCTEAEQQFIGCASSNDLCPSLGKTLCDGDDGYWRTSGCVPDNLEACTAPGELTGDC